MSTKPSPAMARAGLERSACPLCAAALPEPSRAPEGRSGPPGPYRHCPTCGSLVPAEAEPADSDAADLLEDRSARQLADGVVASAASVAWQMAEHLAAPGRCGPIVDLGMGRGGIPNALQTLGYTVMGCEPSAFFCQMARASYLLGPTTLTNTDPDTYLTDLEADAMTVSAVVLWHVIDRHAEPVGLLRRCRRLAPGGVLFTEWPIPRGDGIGTEHRFFPTPATLIHLADTLDLVVASASVAADGLRVFFQVPADDVVDLDQDRRHRLDVAALEASYRAVSPGFAAAVPGPLPAGASNGSSDGHQR